MEATVSTKSNFIEIERLQGMDSEGFKLKIERYPGYMGDYATPDDNVITVSMEHWRDSETYISVDITADNAEYLAHALLAMVKVAKEELSRIDAPD